MNKQLYMKLRETKEHPEVKVALYKLKLEEAAKVLNKLYVPNSSIISESDLKELPTLYSLLKQRSHGSVLDPNGYLGFANHNESYRILEQLNLELVEQINHIRMLEALVLGIDKERKVKDENDNELHPSLLQIVYDDITREVNPYRGEWLNDKFEINLSEKYLIKQKLKNGKLEQVREELHPDTLMDYRKINLRDLVKYHTPQGFPRRNIPTGDELSYLHPKNNYVAGLGTDSDGLDLYCGSDPLGSYPWLGMRTQI